MTPRWRILLLALALLLPSVHGFAARPQPLFSAELEFTNREIEKGNSRSPDVVDAEVTVLYKNRFKHLVMQKCPECRAERRTDRHGANIWRIEFPDHWWFEITTDPFTLEIKTKPSTAQELRRLQPRLQRYIFDTAHALGTIGHYEDTSAAQIHVGVLSAFGKDTMRFRNFLVDEANHSGLAAGVLFKDFSNAPPLARLPENRIERFRNLVEPKVMKGQSIEAFATALRERVFDRTVEPGWDPPEKFHSFALNRIDSEEFPPGQWTTEVRALPAHEEAESFLRTTELLDARIAYLDERFGERALGFKLERIRGMSDQQKVDEFFTYIAESGLRWRDYVSLVSYRYRHIAPSMAAARKALGGWGSPRFVEHMMDLIDLRVYDKAAIKRALSQAPASRRAAAEKVRAKLEGAAPAIQSFDAPFHQPVRGYEREFLMAAKRARVPGLRENTRLQPAYGELAEHLEPLPPQVLGDGLRGVPTDLRAGVPGGGADDEGAGWMRGLASRSGQKHSRKHSQKYSQRPAFLGAQSSSEGPTVEHDAAAETDGAATKPTVEEPSSGEGLTELQKTPAPGQLVRSRPTAGVRRLRTDRSSGEPGRGAVRVGRIRAP